MKKKVIAGVMMITVLITSGCGKNDEQGSVNRRERTSSVYTVNTTETVTTVSSSATEQTTAEQTTETVPGTVTDTTTEVTTEMNTAETTTASTTETEASSTESTTETAVELPKPEYLSHDLNTGDGMQDFLTGSWELIPYGNPISNGDKTVLSFVTGSSMLDLNRLDNGLYMNTYIQYDALFGEGKDRTNYFKLQVDYCSDAELNMTDSTAHMQLMTAITDSGRVIGLRESGNGSSMFGHYGLDEDKAAWDFMWVFKKTDQPAISDEMNDSLRIKGKSFYAFKWFDAGNIVYLQPMEVEKLTDNWYGEDLNCLSYIRTEGESGLYAPYYEIKGAEDKANSGSYKPGLCYVTTDEKGVITDIKNYRYLGYGYYNADETY